MPAEPRIWRRSLFRWRLHSFFSGLCVGISLLSSIAAHAEAQTEVECASLGLPNPVFGVGGYASMNLLGKVAGKLRSAASPLTLFYSAPGACAGITFYVDGQPLTGTATYWEPDGETTHTCTLPALGVVPDFGITSVEGTYCAGVAAILPGIGEFRGPITSWSLVARNDSSQTSISAQALYFIFGFGALQGQVAPWTLDSEIYTRNSSSAATIAIALAAGIPLNRFRSHHESSQNIVDVLAASTHPQAALGYANTDFVDKNRDVVHTLAFQAYGQECGYFPDSSANATDKANVRNGHYYLWSPYRFYAPVDEKGEIIPVGARQFIGYFSGRIPAPADVPILDIEIALGNIPECAMRVTRDQEIGPLASYLPEASCQCYFEFKVSGTTTCTPCSDDTQCVGESPICRHGYCEVK